VFVDFVGLCVLFGVWFRVGVVVVFVVSGCGMFWVCGGVGVLFGSLVSCVVWWL